LWIDGWLTEDEPDRNLEISLELGGKEYRHRVPVLVSEEPFPPEIPDSRIWILAFPVEGASPSSARVRGLTLVLSTGELFWHGGRDRLIEPDPMRRFRALAGAPVLLPRTDAFLRDLRREEFAANLDEDPHFRENLRALRAASTGTGGSRSNPVLEQCLEDAAELELDGESAYDLLEPARTELAQNPELSNPHSVGPQARRPRVTQIVNLVDSTELLEHHFVHGWSGDEDGHPRELLLLFGPDANRAEIRSRLDGLVDLYRQPARLFFQRREATWGAALHAVAQRARGDVLLFCDGRAFGLDSGGYGRIVRSLIEDPDVAMVVPSPVYFDGTTRIRGFSNGTVQASPGACPSECFALSRTSYLETGGFTGRYFHPAFEMADLCRRMAEQSSTVCLVAAEVTVLEGADDGRRGGEAPSPTELHDLERFRRREESGFAAEPAVDSQGRQRPEGQSNRAAPSVTTVSSAAGLRASIVIPTFNPGPELASVLDRIERQEAPGHFDILVVDSGSTDGTTDLLDSRDVPKLEVRHEEFNHGLTRQLAAERTQGDVVVFLSQDALPEPGWLGGLLVAFDDPAVAGAYSRQIPRPEASPFAVDQLSRWPATDRTSRRQRLSDLGDFDALPLSRKIETVCFDNVSSAVRRTVLDRIPFRDVGFGSDRDWAYRALKAGHTIAYRPSSRVIHSHDRSTWYELKRTFCDHRALRELFGEPIPRDLSEAFASFRSEALRLLDVATRTETPGSRIRNRLKAPVLALARNLGSFLGAKAADRCPDGSRLWTFLSHVLTRGI
jgi:rhamnosyltransferase